MALGILALGYEADSEDPYADLEYDDSCFADAAQDYLEHGDL